MIYLSKRSNTKEFIARAKKLKPDHDYSKIVYVNSYTKVIITCPEKHEFSISPDHFLHGRDCRTCGYISSAKKQSSNTKEFIDKAKKIKPDHDYSKVIYANSRTKVIIICPKGHKFSIVADHFLRGQGCGICSITRKSNTEEFIARAKKIKPDHDYSEVVYVNNKTKVIITCPEKHRYLITPNNFLNGHDCRICGYKIIVEKRSSNTEEFTSKAKKIKPDHDYSKVVYINARIKVIITCPKKHEFLTSPETFLSGHDCPTCNLSKGEEAIRKLLEKYNISYNPQEEFEGLVGLKKGNLSFDFAISKKDKLLFLLEYQGEQHFRPWKTSVKYKEIFKSASKRTKAHDRIKKAYCTEHKIPLEFINYDEDIEERLDDLMEKYNLK